MSRYFHAVMLFLLCLNITAQQKVVYGDSFDFTPKEFSYDGKPIIQFKSEDKISLYNNNIDIVKEIPIVNHEYEYVLQYQQQKREIKNINSSSYESLDRGFDEYYTFDQFMAEQEMMGGSNYTIVRKKLSDNEVMIYSYYEGYQSTMFFHSEMFGTKYPLLYFIYKADENVLYRYECRYSVEYTEWEDNGIKNDRCTKSTPLVEILYRNLDEGSCHDGVEFYTSQTLFNDDEDFEYIIPKVTMLEGGIYSFLNPDVIYGQEPIVLEQNECITKNGRPAYTGFQILSSNGSVVGEIDFGSNYTMDDYDPYVRIITIGDKTYLAADCVDESKEDSYCTIFYLIDKHDGSIDRINVAPREPKIRQKNNTINVNLSSCDKPSTIDIYNVGGAKVASKKANVGQENVSLNLNAPKGIYNVTRVQEGKIIESQKFMLQ